jgi:alpha-glucosidase
VTAAETVTCAVNVAAEPFALPEGELLPTSGPLVDDALPANTAAWVRARSA